MLKTYKYRIYPTEIQRGLMQKIFGQVRFVYNLGLETKITAYMGNKKNVDVFDLVKQIKELKDTECPWLKESDYEQTFVMLEMVIMLIQISFVEMVFLSLRINIPNNLFNYHKESG